MLSKKDCFAYISNHYCSATIRTDCINCSFYKSKEKLNEKIKDDVEIKQNINIEVKDIDSKRFNIGFFKNNRTKEDTSNEQKRGNN